MFLFCLCFKSSFPLTLSGFETLKKLMEKLCFNMLQFCFFTYFSAITHI